MVAIDCARVVYSLVAAELARLRKCPPLSSELAEIGPETEIGDDVLALATAVSGMFHVAESGGEGRLLRHRRLGEWAEIASESLNDIRRITFKTSGSTGSPKASTHALSELQQEIDVHAATVGKVGRVIALVPSHHIYGFLWTVMLPQQLRAEAIDARRWSPGKIAADHRSGDLLVGIPLSLRNVGDAVHKFRQGVAGVSSGAPCSDVLFEQLQEKEMRLAEVYGSSETGGVGVRSSTAAFDLLPLWQRARCDDGLASDRLSSDRLRRFDEDGRETRIVQAPDYLIWEDNRHFRVGARRDGAVQVRGVNVYPSLVAARLRECPFVRDCSVRLMRPEQGERLKAFVVLGSNESDRDRQALESWIEDQFLPEERPVQITLGDRLPETEFGKACDWD